MERRGQQWREPRMDYRSEDSGDEHRKRHPSSFGSRHHDTSEVRHNNDSNGSTLLKMSSSCPFNYWKTNVILQLKHLDLWDVVSGMFEEPERGDTLFKEWKQKDQHAFFLLHRSLSYSQADRLGPIENIENSQQLWTAILRNNSDIVSKTSYLRFLNDLSRI